MHAAGLLIFKIILMWNWRYGIAFQYTGAASPGSLMCAMMQTHIYFYWSKLKGNEF